MASTVLSIADVLLTVDPYTPPSLSCGRLSFTFWTDTVTVATSASTLEPLKLPASFTTISNEYWVFDS